MRARPDDTLRMRFVGDQRQQALREEYHALEMDVDGLVELRFGDVGDRRVQRAARVVDEKVENSRPKSGRERLLQLVRQGREFGGVLSRY